MKRASKPLQAESFCPIRHVRNQLAERVIAIGSGKLLDDGSRAKSQLKEGEHVLFSSYAGETVEIDDVEYLLMREDDVLAVVE